MQSLLSPSSALSPSLPSLALAAISNGLQTAKMTSNIPLPTSNMLPAPVSVNLISLGPNLPQVPSSLPAVRPNLSQISSYLPRMGPSLPQIAPNIPAVGPNLSQMASNLPTGRPSLGQMATNLPTLRQNLPPSSSVLPSSSSLSQMASSLPAFTPNLPPALSNFPIASPNGQTTGVDVSVLNNLAIALQLLILSNILNSSPEVSELNSSSSNTESLPNPTKPKSVSYMPVNNNENQYTNVPTQKDEDIINLLNANFLGTSNFAENSMMLHNFGGNPVLQGSSKKMSNPRTGFTLMSPYEALGPNSAFSDPILSSPYASSYGRSEFNSPYSDFEPYSGFDSDLFSMTDIL